MSEGIFFLFQKVFLNTKQKDIMSDAKNDFSIKRKEKIMKIQV